MNVGIGAYSLHQDARYYGKPGEFIPERWLSEGPEPVDRNAFMTFPHGPYSCVGKHFGLYGTLRCHCCTAASFWYVVCSRLWSFNWCNVDQGFCDLVESEASCSVKSQKVKFWVRGNWFHVGITNSSIWFPRSLLSFSFPCYQGTVCCEELGSVLSICVPEYRSIDLKLHG
jgi:hypothetical protein